MQMFTVLKFDKTDRSNLAILVTQFTQIASEISTNIRILEKDSQQLEKERRTTKI